MKVCFYVKGFHFMKNCIATSLCFFLVVFMVGCGKNDTPSTSVGILYTPGNIKNENHRDETSQQDASTAVYLQQLSNKLKVMNNDDVFRYALDLQNQGRYSEALAAYNKIIETDESYPEIYYHRGLLYRDMDAQDEAICAFQTAVIQNPDSAEIHYNLGYAYQRKGLYTEAITEYQKALGLISENKTKQKSSIHFNLGSSYFSQGSIDDAISEYEKVLTYNPRDKETHQKLGIAYTAKGWVDKAKNEFSLSTEK
ncbi:MAG: tetratricopeptide repeat protein [wastewater metagenome]|nr:tetratricopeptide repeat protein [Candidatus Loosdrechtia aerotolerans]